MIDLAAGVVAGALLTFALLRVSVGRLTLSNYRGATVRVVGGVVLAGGLAAGLAAEAIFGDYGASTDRLGMIAAAAGFFVLGLADDLVGDRRSKGIGGHLRALLEGTVTTGAVKAVGGLILAGLIGLWWEESLALAILDGLVIALAANFLNLLDLRPGRACKGFLLLLIPLYAATGSVELRQTSAALAGATLAWLPADLREKGMLGDSGANMLGAVWGAGAVLTLAPGGRIVLGFVLAVLTAASERWSFTRAIERTPPLRWLDRLGRR